MSNTISPDKFIEECYKEAEALTSNISDLTIFTKPYSFLEPIVNASEKSKGVYTVFLTSIVYKCLYPEQDIRRHQSSIEGGYSGRTFDNKYITPFLKQQDFPSMAESGWLTRSLEQKMPYDKDYPGAIKPKKLKESFLEGIDFIQTAPADQVKKLLTHTLAALIVQRRSKVLTLAKPTNLSIEQIIDLLHSHFTQHYPTSGAARLPVLAIYAVYELLTEQIARFNGKQLLPIERHTSSDMQSGRVGDIDVVNSADEKPFEGVEVKFEIPITATLLTTIRNKILTHTLDRYYVLSTNTTIEDEEREKIKKIVNEVKDLNGCQLIVNGIYDSLKYYLRLLEKPELFIEKYVALLEVDQDIKFEHREMWNNLVFNTNH